LLAFFVAGFDRALRAALGHGNHRRAQQAAGQQIARDQLLYDGAGGHRGSSISIIAWWKSALNGLRPTRCA